MRCRTLASLALALFCLACSETKTPTEPVPAVVAPTPAPTVLPGQPASMSGTVHGYGCPSCPLAGYVVGCQGKTATSATDGSYTITGLTSGVSSATVQWPAPTIETDEFTVSLKPGSNSVSFDIY